ncbi:MAG: YidC/Oxa1 family membrane protein insertase [Patescibacteria group bacterium]
MFETILVKPIYNAFILLTGLMPGSDAGLAIIAVTILMRIVLYPVFTSAIRTQLGMAAMQPELESIKEKYANNREQLAREQMALFKRYKVNPLSGIASFAVQLVVMLALYFALFREGFPAVDQDLLYSFVHAPAVISTTFFGLIDLLTPNHLILSVLVALSQFAAIKLTLRRTPSQKSLTAEKAQVQRMQQNLLLYFMPGLMGVFSFFFPGAVGLYFLASNLLSLGQEWLIKHKFA